MRFRLALLSTLLVLAFVAAVPHAEPARFEASFGILVKDGTCPDATHILRYPCGSGPDYYLVFPKGKEGDVAGFLNQNVGIRGTLKATTCALPLVQVSKITLSPILPPCVEP